MVSIKSGDIFWCTSQGEGQEEQGRHPWIAISVESRTSLAIAVPMTSNITSYGPSETYVNRAEIEYNMDCQHPLDQAKGEGVVKCAKLRHWSFDRVDEIIGSATKYYVNRLRGIVADVLAIPRR
ncbi:MAG: type II toxin-antitoxin system PemK/MazF family toxin [Deltaproteobacteria bacterium]|nr:type II toxin-antitoxin system PemK/MazF family toxin [Deltaproteobacteria bacterium]